MTHKCDPPCDIMRIAEARERRKGMTKPQLLAAFDQADDAWFETSAELEMESVYAGTLREAILRVLDSPFLLPAHRKRLERAVYENETLP